MCEGIELHCDCNSRAKMWTCYIAFFFLLPNRTIKKIIFPFFNCNRSGPSLNSIHGMCYRRALNSIEQLIVIRSEHISHNCFSTIHNTGYFETREPNKPEHFPWTHIFVFTWYSKTTADKGNEYCITGGIIRNENDNQRQKRSPQTDGQRAICVPYDVFCAWTYFYALYPSVLCEFRMQSMMKMWHFHMKWARIYPQSMRCTHVTTVLDARRNTSAGNLISIRTLKWCISW